MPCSSACTDTHHLKIRQHIIIALLHDTLAFEARNTTSDDRPSNTFTNTLDTLVCVGPAFVGEDLHHPVTVLFEECSARYCELTAAIKSAEDRISASERLADSNAFGVDEGVVDGAVVDEWKELLREKEKVRRCWGSAEMVLGMVKDARKSAERA